MAFTADNTRMENLYNHQLFLLSPQNPYLSLINHTIAT
jgi:hypothetical protein